MVKIVHCSDVHLDSPFVLGDPRNAELRRMELRASFISLILHARNIDAKIFIIAGDLFDQEYISKETASMLYKEMARFSECKFFISPGDCDPYHSKSPYKALKWSENVHIFKSNDITKIEIPELNTDVYGYAFTNSTLQINPFKNKKPQNSQRINILVGHGDMTSPTSVHCPIKKSDLENSGFDYIALGHIHSATGVAKVGTTHFSYPGGLEGRNFDEPGHKGAMCGDIDKGICNLKGVRFSKRRYETEEIDITECLSQRDILEKIFRYIGKYKNDTALRINLIGRLSPNFSFNPMDIESEIKDVYFTQIFDHTKPYIDPKIIEDNKTLKGIFYRKLKDKLESSDEKENNQATMILKYGLNAFSDVDIIDF